ncbi:helicase C-terminal domain-containing protein [Tistrella sp.]|uniref:helicase C-terminal domain-containing protein n=1 Tax=Tistrella sp. TaxID=2024861 RepID=UPI0025E1D875|nr:helicase C-terminal domain-containing protein [Tistrella sp.]
MALDVQVDSGQHGAVTALEAETGVGKSLGYLVPLLLRTALVQRKGLVSTFTLQLQQQLLDEDTQYASEVCHTLLGVRPKIAKRMGLRNFLSPTRVEALAEALHAKHRLTPDIKDILDALFVHAKQGGDMREWISAYGQLPPTIDEGEICLLPTSPEEESERYRAHLADAIDADVLVVTHALLMTSALRWNTVLSPKDNSEGGFDAAVIDEADRLSDAAALSAQRRVNSMMLQRAARFLSHLGAPDPSDSLLKEIATWRRDMDALYGTVVSRGGAGISRLGHEEYIVLSDPRHAAVMMQARGAAVTMAAALKEGYVAAQRRGAAEDDLRYIRDIAAELRDFVAGCEDASDFRVPMLSWSPVREWPAFALVGLRPGRLSARLWRSSEVAPPFIRSMVMTSATLDAPGDGEATFSELRTALGLIPGYSNFQAELSDRFRPRKFGRLSFVLADRRVPNPSSSGASEADLESDGDGGSSHPQWLAYVAAGIKMAAESGGRVLALTNSFRDTSALGALLESAGSKAIVHQPGMKLGDMIPTFVADENAVWISPTAWEGLNLPGTINHLVITRLPFPYFEPARRLALLDSMMARGYSLAKARGVIYGIAQKEARRRLRQGIGRAIRAESDSATVWILDPRFPLPDSITRDPRQRIANTGTVFAPFVSAIPDRFRTGLGDTYSASAIFPLTIPDDVQEVFLPKEEDLFSSISE